MAGIFDTVKRIMTTKDKWEDIPEEERNAFNNWMCNKVLSMNEDYVEVVNFVQKNTWRIESKHLYELYKDLIPKGYVFSKWIKNQNKKEYDDDHVAAVQTYYQVSEKDAKEYIDMLPEEEVIRIHQQINQ